MERKAKAIQLSDTFPQRECIAVEFQEGCKVPNCILSWVPMIVISPTFVKNMPSSFDWI